MTSVKQVLFNSIALGAIAGVLSACSDVGANNGGNDPVPGDVSVTISSTAADVTGSAVKGTLSNASATVEALGGSTVTLSGATSDDAGAFSGMVVTSEAGFGLSDSHRFSVASGADTTMICDVPTCGTFAFGEAVPSTDLGALQLESVVWVEAPFNAASDTTVDGAFQANALTTLASELLDLEIAAGGRTSSQDLLTSLQLTVSDQLLRILGVDISGVNLFTTSVVSAHLQENFTGLSDDEVTLSLVNAAFANFAAGSTLADRFAALSALVRTAAIDEDIAAATQLRQAVLDALAGHPAEVWLSIDVTTLIDLNAPLTVENVIGGPIQEYTTPDRIAAATISRRAAINVGEEAEFAFDGDANTKWLDNGGAPTVADPAFVQVEFADAVPVSVLALTSANDAPSRDPENFALLASNNGVDFVTIGSVEGAAFNDRFETQQFVFNNTLPFTIYRLDITKNFGDDGLMQVGEIEFFGAIDADVNHSLNPAKTVTRRAAISAGEEAEFSLDGDINTKWLDNGGAPSVADPSFIQLDFASPVAVSSLGVISANDAPDRDLENFTLLGSNDAGVTWNTIGTVEGAVFAERFERQVFPFGNGLPYASYRLNITKNFGDGGLTQVAEIELIGPEDPSVDHTTGATITARAEISAAEAGPMAFDDDINTKWLDNGGVPSAADPSFVQIDLAGPEAVNFLSVTSANDAPSRDPENFNVQGSNDGGTTWATIAEFDGVTFAERFERQAFLVPNSAGFSSYRFNITKNFGDDGLMQIAEIELAGPTEPAVDHSTGATITARAEISAAEAGPMAFDDDVNTKWLDNGSVPSVADPAYVDVALAAPAIVNEIAVTSANDAPSRDPENFQLLGSNDGGVTWFTVASFEGVTFANRFERQNFQFVNGRSFNLYRFNITKNFGDDGLMQVAEIELLGPPNN